MPFQWGSAEGWVEVEVGVNDDPAAVGCPEFARGFPICHATIRAPSAGYQHLGGWLQLVDHSDREEGFEVDQYPPLGDVSHPFCFFGFSPPFFDAPHGDDSEDWDFLANTFFCGFGGSLLEFRREARAILGFSWGFSRRRGRIGVFGPTPLSGEDWDDHRDLLTERYGEAGWEFAPGFAQHPLRS